MALLRPRLLPNLVNNLFHFSSTPFPTRSFASRRAANTDDQDEDLAAARTWLANLNTRTMPRHLCEISFSRSGGPGGQHVNKVNSKATLRVSLDDLFPLIPRIIHPQLQSCRYVAQRTNTLVIQSEESRKQAANVETCFDKLHQLLQKSANEVIPGETSRDQKEKVQKLKKAENEARIKYKKLRSSKKSSRRGSDD
ncbi:peptidyl-tRNA hydrolase domain protein [Aspergillus ruber CBS 135680]|uniref:Prokaryotic-type class I peptide chain release factors domain-containing protein n=1 Tax=Aspergillus ruber (strain CBS 135680) TaxID=1388766 RepID=A0A017SMK3_ASPRC|nr:uncharacterized protein EURHEDRAFT_384175 [Aspergillus ruber CBS 135680]EYE98208.1 hypothetical protein EURHEDRAFT_384175 [Aspergillus ruber CBS 135680]